MVGAGAAKGIGLACASCLGHEGAKVVVADLDEEGAKRYLNPQVMQWHVLRELCLPRHCHKFSRHYVKLM